MVRRPLLRSSIVAGLLLLCLLPLFGQHVSNAALNPALDSENPLETPALRQGQETRPPFVSEAVEPHPKLAPAPRQEATPPGWRVSDSPTQVEINAVRNGHWDTSNVAQSTAELYVVIDPQDAIAETTKTNNIAHRTLMILPPVNNTTAPMVTDLQVNEGAPETSDSQVSVTIEADNLGGPPVSTTYLVEREFNASARQWMAVQRSDWITYTNPYTMTLTNRGGVRYIQAWMANSAGTISRATVKTRINYVPPNETVRAGQVRIYRRELAQGQQLTVRLETSEGDADLYIWNPQGTRSWVSNEDGTEPDERTLQAPEAGVYQIEVYGYRDAKYKLSVDSSSVVAAAINWTEVTNINPNKPTRSQPAVAPNQEPAGSSAVPVAPIGPAENASLYLPALMR